MEIARLSNVGFDAQFNAWRGGVKVEATLSRENYVFNVTETHGTNGYDLLGEQLAQVIVPADGSLPVRAMPAVLQYANRLVPESLIAQEHGGRPNQVAL